MTREVKKMLAKHQALTNELIYERHKFNASAARVDEICAEGRAVQFQLLLHMPCRQFFKRFNINREAAL
jgi:hypothetical protein